MKIVPNNGRVIISVHEVEDKTPGGIILPDGSKDKPQIGSVVASGDEFFTEGDTVLFAKYAGHEFSVDDAKFLAMESKDIHCKIVD